MKKPKTTKGSKASKVVDIDYGWRDLMKTFEGLEGEISVVVGVPATADDYKDGANQVLVASVNEFGSDDGRIPERSFLRSTVDEKAQEYSALLAKLVRRVVDGKITPNQALDRLGLTVERDVKRKIVDLKEPPNAEWTIEQKKSSNPLIDTGQLRQSITYEIRREKKP